MILPKWPDLAKSLNVFNGSHRENPVEHFVRKLVQNKPLSGTYFKTLLLEINFQLLEWDLSNGGITISSVQQKSCITFVPVWRECDARSSRRHGRAVAAMPLRRDLRNGIEHRVALQDSRLSTALVQHGLLGLDHGGKTLFTIL